MSKKKYLMIVFFSLVLILYFLVNFYIFKRAMQSVPEGNVLRVFLPYLFWTLASAYVVFRLLEQIHFSTISTVFGWIGAFWLAAMIYFFLIVVFFDLLRLLNHYLDFFPAIISENYVGLKQILFYFSVSSVAILMFFGFINAGNPVINKVELKVDKEVEGVEKISIVLISDIHLGTLSRTRSLNQMVESINSLNPDVVLLAGDILDEDVKAVAERNLCRFIKDINSKHGSYAVLGNHEYIGGHNDAITFLEDSGLTVVRDSVVNVNGLFYLVGRDDYVKKSFTGIDRMELDVLMQSVDKSLPVIVLDHQPVDLQNASELGADIQLSGHTHHGQLWPINFITSSIFPLSRGYGKINNMHAYVSNGFGTWGPPVRIGNRPEIVYITIIPK